MNTEKAAVPNNKKAHTPPLQEHPQGHTSGPIMLWAWAIWLLLAAGGWCMVQMLPPAAPVAPPVAVPMPAPAPEREPPSAPESPPQPAVAVIPLPHASSVSESICAPWLQRWPALSTKLCHAAQLAPSGALSVRGLPLAWRDVAPAQTTTETVRVLIVGAIHGDELTAAALALHWIPLAQQALAQRPVHWRFLPVLNPDGLLARPATRTNASGVDLNRNFPTPGWAQDAPVYWENRTRRDPRRWPGAAPLSEPESVFLHEQIAEFAPQLVVSIHAPYGVLDFDGPQTPPQKLGHLWLDQLGVFPGSLGHYSGVHLGVPVVTIELKHALRMPAATEITGMWQDLLDWMAQHLGPTSQ